MHSLLFSYRLLMLSFVVISRQDATDTVQDSVAYIQNIQPHLGSLSPQKKQGVYNGHDLV